MSVMLVLLVLVLLVLVLVLAIAVAACRWSKRRKRPDTVKESAAGAAVQATEQHPQVFLLPQTPQLKALMTIIRDKETSRADFIFTADRITRLLVEEGLNHLPTVPRSVITPTGHQYDGADFEGQICGVSIMRAGESLESALRHCCRSVRIGKILIQRDEETALPTLFYSKLPQDIASRYVFLLDPMLATGGSAAKAAEVLLEAGVQESRIIFLNVIGSPPGIELMTTRFPQIKIISAEIDAELNTKKYIVPGCGDYGCRYFGTDD
ncbi:PRTase-like protein [Ramicandelaber brevisporus]|nr:PRTase-like protein [Ramicandelaber brevisporus]